MSSSVKIRFGDMFDGPADMFVLPCSTGGTVTESVARRLIQLDIPAPTPNLSIGEVEIIPFEGGEKLSQFVAYAASVHENTSSVRRLEQIGNALGQFTVENASVRLVSAPLLGAGAGGLLPELVVAALRTGFTATAAEGATLMIYVFQRVDYERLRSIRHLLGDRASKQPMRVFISHTSKSEEEIAWVKDLANFLIQRGLQARLDQYHLRRGMDLQQWMRNELLMAKKVVVVSNERYKERADGHAGGVGWETRIIQSDIQKLPPDSTKYQVIVRSAEIEDGLPIYLSTRYVFHSPKRELDMDVCNELEKELLDVEIDPTKEASEFNV